MGREGDRSVRQRLADLGQHGAELLGPFVGVRAEDRRGESRAQAERVAAVVERDHRHPERRERADRREPVHVRALEHDRRRPRSVGGVPKPPPDGRRKCAHSGRSYTIRRRLCRTRLPGAAGRVDTLRAVSELCKTTDVLVVGAGGAGLSAAWAARRSGADVLHVTKGSKASCNTAKAQGGIQAAVGDDDSPEQHAADIWRRRTTPPTRRWRALPRRRRARSPGSRSSASGSPARATATGSPAAGARPPSGCCRSATAPATRSPRAARRDWRRTACRSSTTRRSSGSSGRTATSSRARAVRRAAHVDAGTVVLAAAGAASPRPARPAS